MGQSEGDRENLELLLRLAEFGTTVSAALRSTPDGALVSDNISVLVLSHLELDGPKRPSEFVQITGMSSGGVTKVITRLENAGLAARDRGFHEQDGRAVVVSLTDRGHTLMRAFSRELDLRISDAAVLIKELNRLIA